jgi:uncharacterized membrane protein YhaH (DUF805 family)
LYIVASVRHNLAHLLDFRGRDSSRVFWPYALMVIAVLVAVPMIAVQGRIASFANNASQPAQEISPLILSFAVWLLLAAALLGAAVSRRLRDSNQSPIWGLWPLILAGLNAFFMYQAFTADDIPNAWFLGAFGANLVGLALLVLLIVKLNNDTAPGQAADRLSSP